MDIITAVCSRDGSAHFPTPPEIDKALEPFNVGRLPKE